MATSLVDADSVLVIDVGAVHTRAFLFDVVDGRYRFLASGVSPSTAGAPYNDVGEGMRQAIDQLQAITGRTLVGSDERLIIPEGGDGSGVDSFAATISAGAPLKVLAVGLLDDISVESARRLAMTTYSGQVESVGLNDRRRPEARIDSILKLHPDLILVAGGTEDGASQSVLKLLEAVGLACYLLPEGQRPELLFAGNSGLQEEVRATMEKISHLHLAPNIRPALDIERLDAAQVSLAEILSAIRSQQIPGVSDLDQLAGGGLLPTASALGRVIRFLSKAHASKKGVLGVDVGASATTIAAALAGELSLGVYWQYGLGAGLNTYLDGSGNPPLSEVMRWLTVDASEDLVREYIANKALFPASLPVTQEELAIEQALARQSIIQALKRSTPGFPSRLSAPKPGALPWFEPIVASGSVLTRAATLAQTMLMLLDSLQPCGATTFVLDQHHVAPALGAVAAINPLLAVQVLDSTTFLHLGTVVSPVGNARPGTPVLRLKMTYESGHETTLDVKQGALEVLPLPIGQSAKVQLQPLHRYDVGMGSPGRGGGLRVTGGALGLVIDARGRPLQLPDDPARRQELFKKWLWTLGG